MKINIAIVGAGVAGLALAILATEHGHNVTVFEQKSTLASIGAGVTLWPNATFVLDQLNLLEEVMQISGKPLTMCSIDKYGNAQTLMNIEQLNKACGYPSLTILRQDLMRILYQKAQSLGIKIQFQYPVDKQSLHLFMDQFDLVVGADGRMRSTTRQLMFGQHYQPQYQGFINIVGTSPLSTQLANTIIEYRDGGQRFGIVPSHPGTCYWAAAWPEPLNQEKTSVDWATELTHRFKDWPNAIRQAIQSRYLADVKPIFLHDLAPLPHWHNKNLLLIGDAAHASLPTSGQGACQALEDAWHLVTVLTHDQPLKKALKAFYQRRIEKTTAAQAAGRHIAAQIFSSDDTELVNRTLPDTNQLSQFWMQGLTSDPAVYQPHLE
ncbi:FAD-dependent monooxygenase [Pseudoalteromonas luteoviolacea]|uniref:FAD-dependent monooxygenase n=1 Tax=Pseudoalteromonas luteoviolacea TaxID=43657 RepID=UPI001B35C8DE|nr:FAD-dependent monooxygenase [Pseudoalteromonas luteoviolacea]MBQ4810216.1 FAD-dependent monooxygenase [Pseudoalteromonas luteoviolacea]